MQGLTDEQISELKLVNEWEQKCIPSGGAKYAKDEIGRRCGQGISFYPRCHTVSFLTSSTLRTSMQ